MIKLANVTRCRKLNQPAPNVGTSRQSLNRTWNTRGVILAIDCPSWPGGVDATSRKISRSSFDGADGVVVQLQQIFLI